MSSTKNRKKSITAALGAADASPGDSPVYAPQPAQHPPQPKTNVWAIVSLIFGVIGLIGLPVSVISGIVGLYKAKQGQGGRGLAIAGLALSGVWVLLVAGIFAYYFIIGAYTPDSARPQTGDCIAQIPTDDQPVTAEVVDCADLHEGEVVAVLTMPDGGLPRNAVFDEYGRKCESELAAYSPAATQDPSVGLYVRYPTEELWGHGYRDVTCVATLNPPGTGSIKGLSDGRSPATYFKTGDCIADMPTGDAQQVTLVACDEPHAAEVVAVLMLPDGNYPGQAIIDEYKGKCEQELATYAPTATNDPSVGVNKRYPDADSWALGDRSVTCIATFEVDRTESIKG